MSTEGIEKGGSLIVSTKTPLYLLSKLRSQHEGWGQVTGTSLKRQLWSHKVQNKGRWNTFAWGKQATSPLLGPNKPYYHQYFGCVTCIVLMSNINCPSLTNSKRGTMDLFQSVFEFQLHYFLATPHRGNHFTLQCHIFSSVKQWQYDLSWKVVKLKGKIQMQCALQI